MAYLPKSFVEKHIKIRVRKDRYHRDHSDYEAYMGTDPFTRKTIRITRTDKDDLLKEIRDFYVRHRFGGDAAVRLTAMQALDAKNAYDALAAANIKVSLLDAVSAYIGGSCAENAPSSSKSVLEAYEEYCAAKREGADKNKTVATVGKWAAAVGSKKLVSP